MLYQEKMVVLFKSATVLLKKVAKHITTNFYLMQFIILCLKQLKYINSTNIKLKIQISFYRDKFIVNFYKSRIIYIIRDLFY